MRYGGPNQLRISARVVLPITILRMPSSLIGDPVRWRAAQPAMIHPARNSVVTVKRACCGIILPLGVVTKCRVVSCCMGLPPFPRTDSVRVPLSKLPTNGARGVPFRIFRRGMLKIGDLHWRRGHSRNGSLTIHVRICTLNVHIGRRGLGVPEPN